MLIEAHELDEFQKGNDDQHFHFICHILDEIEEQQTNRIGPFLKIKEVELRKIASIALQKSSKPS